jgi:hypothetical protein
MQFQSKMASMHTHGAVFDRAVVRRLVKQLIADLLFCQFVGVTMDFLFG